ncbi:MAG: hypothetical protein EOO99_00480 [Pedobacter sp.]|nr:MAG: hypothetical protein EOO99_00480 [Pedobacter sp.]
MKKLYYLFSTLLSLPLAVLAQQVSMEQIASANQIAKVKSSSVELSMTHANLDQEDNKANDPSKSKSYSKSFALDRSDKVDVINKYGSITVKTWAKSEVKMDAQITAYARSEKEVIDLLDRVQIQASKAGEQVSYKTEIDLKGINSMGSGTRNGVRWRRELKVHVTLYVPISQAISLSQAYGNINLENHEGPTALRVQYGNLNTGDLKHDNNFASVQYGKATLGMVNKIKMTLAYGENSSIKEAQQLNLGAQYAGFSINKVHAQAMVKMQYGNGFNIGEAGEIEFDGQYTRFNATTIKGNAKIKMQYGSGINIGHAGSLTLTSQYTNLNLKTLAGTFTGSVQYGRINVERLEAGVKQFNVVADYSPVSVGFASNYNASLNVSVSYGSFKYGDRVSAKEVAGSNRSSTFKQFTGDIGNGAGNGININAKYGSVIFK